MAPKWCSSWTWASQRKPKIRTQIFMNGVNQRLCARWRKTSYRWVMRFFNRKSVTTPGWRTMSFPMDLKCNALLTKDNSCQSNCSCQVHPSPPPTSPEFLIWYLSLFLSQILISAVNSSSTLSFQEVPPCWKVSKREHRKSCPTSALRTPKSKSLAVTTVASNHGWAVASSVVWAASNRCGWADKSTKSMALLWLRESALDNIINIRDF